MNGEEITRLVEMLNQVINVGKLPEGTPQEIARHPAVQQFVGQVRTLQEFLLALANGNLQPELHLGGRMAGALKTMQSNLRHLTWQAQRVAGGDLNQRVEFMGEFATAFNAMIEQIRLARQELARGTEELGQQRQAAVTALQEAQTAWEETHQANQQLQEANLKLQAANQKLQEYNRQLQTQLAEIRSLQEQLREQAIRDSLTGCFNRRYLEETMEREFARAVREGYTVGVVMVDIDRFKAINDTFGHAVGDRIVMELGHSLQSLSRTGDIVCRYGGEEFLLLLPGLTAEVAVERAEQWRAAFAALELPTTGRKIRLTISLGVAIYPIDSEDSQEILRKADQALYLAKSNGRNRVELSSASRREIKKQKKPGLFRR